jgi:hypothetical protein
MLLLNLSDRLNINSPKVVISMEDFIFGPCSTSSAIFVPETSSFDICHWPYYQFRFSFALVMTNADDDD